MFEPVCQNLEGSTRMGFSRQQARHPILTGAVAAALFFGLTAAVSAQGAVRSVHGDWQIRCDTPPGASGDASRRAVRLHCERLRIMV